MKATKLYEKLDKDFIKPGLSDEWLEYMQEVKDFLSDNFKKREMGLVLDNSKEIKRIYTAVFPTDEVLKHVAKTKNSLLFLHHPAIWDITKQPVFQNMNTKLLEKLKQNRISIYTLHVPLDNYGKYSTSVCLAKSLEISNLKPFAPYRGGLAGVIGKTNSKTVQELSIKFRKAVGHKTSFYNYGNKKICNRKVAIVAGGGNDKEILEKIAREKINTFITGITALNDYSRKAHEFAKSHKINILGGTHYSTEKFACIEICKYFRKIGLSCKFISGKPGIEDL